MFVPPLRPQGEDTLWTWRRWLYSKTSHAWTCSWVTDVYGTANIRADKSASWYTSAYRVFCCFFFTCCASILCPLKWTAVDQLDSVSETQRWSQSSRAVTVHVKVQPFYSILYEYQGPSSPSSAPHLRERERELARVWPWLLIHNSHWLLHTFQNSFRLWR